MNAANRTRPHLIGQMAEHDAIGQSGRNVFGQLHLQARLDDLWCGMQSNIIIV